MLTILNFRSRLMQIRSFFTRRRPLIFALCITLLLCASCGTVWYTHPANQYKRAASQLFYDEMTASTLNMHYTLAVPEKYGIDDYDAILPCYDSSGRQEGIAALEEALSFYQNLDAEKISPRDAHIKQLLETYLETTLALSQYPYHEEPLSPSSGMQSQLPILLAEYTFRSIRDVEDYLAILAQTGDYFSSLLQFETEKKEAGLLMAASSLRNVARQCRSVITADALKSGEHFLQITFQERLTALNEEQLLTTQDMQNYIQRNDDILTHIMLPAYRELADGLEQLADPYILLEGLAAKPDGADYYEILLKSETGSHRNISQISQLLVTKLDEEFEFLQTLLRDVDYDLLTDEVFQECSELFPLQTCEEMLTDLRNRMTNLFPAFPDAGYVTPSIHVKEVAPCLEEYCAPAFYLTPPLDDTVRNSIYINTSRTISAIDLYTTLAHEGFPGHLYQTVYSNQLQLRHDDTPVQQLLWFGGYLEGWALYVEFMAYDYAAEIMQQAGYPDYASLIQIEKHNRSTQLCLYSLLDILIHHKNADLQQTAEVLAQFGITNSASVSTIYEYITEEPTNYPKYYLGYLEILLLKDECREAWAENYSDLTFHKFFLDNGPADLGTLNKLVATEAN